MVNFDFSKFDKYTFFWSGPFSNWTTAEFVLDGQKYSCTEQYYMYKKALAFGDISVANAIMLTTNPKEQKALGRQVRGFNIEQWATISRDVMFRANLAKYLQNEDFYKKLMATDGTLIVEASPVDKIWGIGLDAKTAAVTPFDQWQGKNWLGQVLTEVRETLALF